MQVIKKKDNRVKFLRRFFAATILLLVILSAFYLLWLSPRYVVPILMYHRFGYDNSSLFVTPENFAKQMAYLKNKGYEIISLNELVKGIISQKKFKHNTVVITIDDGYKDNYLYAYPIIKEYDFTATIFIIANFIDNKEDFLTWNEIKRMSANKIYFGAHTKNNIYLPSVEKIEVLLDETSGCKELIESKIGMPIHYFCYPTGGFTEKIKAILKEAGYKGACTTNRGFSELNKDVYELKRIKVTNSDMTKPLNFWAKLSGYYNLFRSRKGGEGY